MVSRVSVCNMYTRYNSFQYLSVKTTMSKNTCFWVIKQGYLLASCGSLSLTSWMPNMSQSSSMFSSSEITWSQVRQFCLSIKKRMYSSYYYYGAVLSMKKSASRMLINPRIVFKFTRQRWSSNIFSSYLALLVWSSNIYIISHVLLLSSRNISFFWINYKTFIVQNAFQTAFII